MTVARLQPNQIDAAVDVLCDAFSEYPVMRFVIGPAGDAYQERLRTFIGFFTAARFHHDDVVLGVTTAEGLLAAVANITRPGQRQTSPALDDQREAVWRELGQAARERYEALGRIWQTFAIDRPHYHLNMIGARRSLHGRGLGRLLLEALHRMSDEDPASHGVSLTTEDAANVPLYEHFGYRVTGSASVSGDLQTWGFFRATP